MQTNNKLRKELETLVDVVDAWKDHLPPVIREGELAKAIKKAEAAPAAPPRNCDVGTAGEQEDRFAKYCRGHNYCAVCPIRKSWDFKNGRRPSCAILWAQMPYEEGGDK